MTQPVLDSIKDGKIFGKVCVIDVVAFGLTIKNQIVLVMKLIVMIMRVS